MIIDDYLFFEVVILLNKYYYILDPLDSNYEIISR